MTERVDCAVIGAGVVGLAIARRLALTGRSVVVLERNDSVGAETSARNSEVIHAGIYYAAGSLKARLCLRGKAMLYAYLSERGLPYARPGKLIVATGDDQRDGLHRLARFATGNGVDDLETLDARALTLREPAVHGIAALWSPSTGIVDAHALMLSLEGDLESAGGLVALGSEVDALTVTDSGIELEVSAAGEAVSMAAVTVVNAAGLGAATIASRIRKPYRETVPQVRYAKGNYFVYRGASPFSHLIYPLPSGGGLGIHATLDLAGRIRFGPDVEWSETVDYSLDPARADSFYAAIRRYWPGLPDGGLEPGYVGVRPKLSGPGEPATDFLIQQSVRRRDMRLIQLFGIESPGLTSCLAIADHVCDMVEDRG